MNIILNCQLTVKWLFNGLIAGWSGVSRRNDPLLWRLYHNKPPRPHCGPLHFWCLHRSYQSRWLNSSGRGGARYNRYLSRHTRCLCHHEPSKIQQWQCRLWLFNIDSDRPFDIFGAHYSPNMSPRLHPLLILWWGGHGDWVGADLLWWQYSIDTAEGRGDGGVQWRLYRLLSWENSEVWMNNEADY